jgi:putative heme transporter
VSHTTPAPAQRPVWRRLLRPTLALAALAVVFGWVLPRFIDYQQVWDTLEELNAPEVAVLAALALGRVPTEALMYRAFLPGLSLWRGSAAYLSSNLAGQLLPPPAPSVIQYGYFRDGGHTADAAGLAALGSFLFPTFGRLLLPVVAVAVLLIAGEVDGAILLAAGLSLIVTGIAGVTAYGSLRTERSARRLGAKLERPLSWALVKLKGDPIRDGADQAARLRTNTLTAVREGWALGTIGVAANLLITYLILLAALRFVGVSGSELPAADAFAAFAIAFWAGAVFPITGSGLGVVDAVLIGALIELSSASDDALVAAALLWRVFYSIIPLPLGALTLSRFRTANPEALPRGGD